MFQGEPAIVTTSVLDLTERAAAQAEARARARRCTRARSWPRWARCWPASRTSSTTRSRSWSATPSCWRARHRTPATRQRAESCTPPPSAARGSSRPSWPWRGEAAAARAGRAQRGAGGALDLAGYGLRSAGIEIVRELPRPTCRRCAATPTSCTRYSSTSIVNAQQALLQAGRAPRRLRVAPGATGRRACCIEVADNGPGIADGCAEARSSSRSSPPSRKASAPASACRSATASSRRTAAGSRSTASSAGARASA